MFILSKIFLCLSLFLAVAFITLLERKVLGFSALRKSVNKVSLIGLLQPLSDALKLISKGSLSGLGSNFYFYCFSVYFYLLIILLSWDVFNYFSESFSELTVMFLFVLTSVHIYPLLMMCWFSGSKYSVLGLLRTSGVTISLDIVMFVIFLLLQNSSTKLNFTFLTLNNNNFCYLPIWFLFLLMSVSVAPFDLFEAESELVGGFSTEFMSFFFMLISLSEYASVVMFCLLTSLIFGGISFLFSVGCVFLFRVTYVRLKMDWMMQFTWVVLFPLIFVLFSTNLFVG